MSIADDAGATQTADDVSDRSIPPPPAAPRISLFANARTTKPIDELTLHDALARIRDGAYEQEITAVRQILAAQGKEAYTKEKNALPAFTFAGTFSRRNNRSLIAHSGIVHGDLDHLDDVEATRQRLIADPYVTYCFISPSGTGLKLGVSVPIVPDDPAYKVAWQQVADYFKTRYQVVWDPSGKDIARLCFVSWDAALYLAPKAQLFPVRDRREQYAEQAINTAVQMIETSAPGHLHEARLKAANLLGGYVAGGFLTYDRAYTVLEAAVRSHTQDFERSMKAIADGLAHGQQRPFSLSQLEAERAEWYASRSRNGQPSPMNGQPQDHDVDDWDDTSIDDEYPPYIFRNNSLLYVKVITEGRGDDKKSIKQEVSLANFMAWIREERTEDDGAELKRIVAMDATIQNGKSFRDIAVSIADFYSLAGLLKSLGTEAVVSPGTMVKDRIRHAIQLYSNRKKYPQRHVFTHLGWRKIDGVWCYLHAGGSIPAKVDVAVETALERYALPPVRSAPDAIRASLRVLDCAPLRITVPLLALVYLAPLAEWLQPNLTGWLEGPSGARKTSLAALILSHYGVFSGVHPPASWESTANALERLAFLVKDAVLWIDDYAPRQSAKEMQAQEGKAQRLIRGQGNLDGRGRMRADMSLRPAYYPRGITLSTGELHPSGTSTFARMLQLDVTKDDIKLEALTTSQAESALLAETMWSYIEWLQPHVDRIVPELIARKMELRSIALAHLTGHTRQPDVYALLGTAWGFFLSFAQEMGVLTDQERQEHWHVGSETLINAINRQRVDAEAEDPTERFCAHLREAFIQGSAYVEDVRGGNPLHADQWGWVFETIVQANGHTSDEWRPNHHAALLGWIDDDFVYLLPEATYRLAFERCQRAGTLLLPQTALWKLLTDKGYLRRGTGRYATKKRISSNTYWVLTLTRASLDLIYTTW